MPRPAGLRRGSATAGRPGRLHAQEASRFIPRGPRDPHTDMTLAWELLYRLEPELYDRLAAPSGSIPGCGLAAARRRTGSSRWARARTADDGLARPRAGAVVAIEPALPMRRILRRKLAAAGHGTGSG